MFQNFLHRWQVIIQLYITTTTWYHNLSWCHNAPLSPITCPKTLKQSCSGMGRITELSYLYLYLILTRTAKINILCYLGDKRGFIFLSYLRYFFKLSSPTLSCTDFSPKTNATSGNFDGGTVRCPGEICICVAEFHGFLRWQGKSQMFGRRKIDCTKEMTRKNPS